MKKNKNEFLLGDKVRFKLSAKEEIDTYREKYNGTMFESFQKMYSTPQDFSNPETLTKVLMDWYDFGRDIYKVPYCPPYQYTPHPHGDKEWKSLYVVTEISRIQNCKPTYALTGIYKNGKENEFYIAWVSGDILEKA